MLFTADEQTLLEQCTSLTSLASNVSKQLALYFNANRKKTQVRGLRDPALQFVGICHNLWLTEAILTKAHQAQHKLPAEVAQELEIVFRRTAIDLKELQNTTLKHVELEKKGKFQKIFTSGVATDKLTESLSKDRDTLRMSRLALKYTVGDAAPPTNVPANVSYQQLRILLGVRGPLDQDSAIAQAQRQSSTQTVAKVLSTPPLSPPTSVSRERTNLAIFPPQQVAPRLQRLSMTTIPRRPSDLDLSHSRVHGPKSEISSPLSDRRLSFGATNSARSSKLTVLSAVRELAMMSNADSHSETDCRDDTSETDVVSVSQFDGMVEELERGKNSPPRVIHLRADTKTVPRWTPKRPAGSSSLEAKSALIHAVHQRNHKLIEELLDNGVPPDCSDDINPLQTAVENCDAVTVRLLLLFGANPNAFDKNGLTPLLTAAEVNSVEGAKMLMKYGADANLSAGNEGETPLALSVVGDKFDLLQLFLRYGGDANAIMPSGDTAFVKAMNRTTSIKSIDLILRYGGNPNGKNREGKTPLVEAVMHKRVDLISLLIDHGANVNLPGPKHPLWPATYDPMTLKLLIAKGARFTMCPGIMELATSINNVDSIHILLKAGVDPNVRKDSIYTPLCTAIRDNRGQIVSLLLKNGADPNLPASEYPAFKCITHNHFHLLPQLVAAGADLHTPKGIVETAIAYNNKEALEYLLARGVNPNDKNQEGNTPLTTAIRDDRGDFIDVLLARGANPAIKGQDWPVCMAVKRPAILEKLLAAYKSSDQGGKPINVKGLVEQAVMANSLESVKLLLAAGLSVEDKTGGVFSPLTTAIREDRRDIVRFLLNEALADVNAPGEHLPLVKALRRSRGSHDTDIVEWLLDKGADVNLVYRGWNAIMQGVESGDLGLLQLLLTKGNKVDLEVKDEDGRTVVEIVSERGWEEARLLLLDDNIA